MGSLVAAEPVGNAAARRRFVEVPFVLHRHDARWAPPLLTYERRRIDRRRNPFLRGGGRAGLFLVRRAGVVVGRISAHVAPDHTEDGWFGFFDVADDEAAAGQLVDAARQWLRAEGCTTITGPASFTVSTEAGVLVRGHDLAGVTGRPWHPSWYAAHLRAAGLAPIDDETGRFPAWRVDPAVVVDAGRGRRPGAGPFDTVGGRAGRPTVTGRYSDPTLVLRGGAGTVAAVPDLSAALRDGGALAAARAARRRELDTCVVVVVDGEPGGLIPAVAAAAARSGYGTMVTPWVPPGLDVAPATVHQLFGATL